MNDYTWHLDHQEIFGHISVSDFVTTQGETDFKSEDSDLAYMNTAYFLLLECPLLPLYVTDGSPLSDLISGNTSNCTWLAFWYPAFTCKTENNDGFYIEESLARLIDLVCATYLKGAPGSK